jgi:hypothetical protein
MSKIKALFFDVGGTVFDWRTGITKALREWGSKKGIEAGWPKLGVGIQPIVICWLRVGTSCKPGQLYTNAISYPP